MSTALTNPKPAKSVAFDVQPIILGLLATAAHELKAAKKACDSHDGPRAGPEWQAKFDTWRLALIAWERLAGAVAVKPENVE